MGVQSRGPNPYVAFTQARQAEFPNEGEYMAWRDSGSTPSPSSCSPTRAPTRPIRRDSSPTGRPSRAGCCSTRSATRSPPTSPSSSRSGCPGPGTVATWPCGRRSVPPPHGHAAVRAPRLGHVDRRRALRPEQLRGLRQHVDEPPLGRLGATALAPARLPCSGLRPDGHRPLSAMRARITRRHPAGVVGRSTISARPAPAQPKAPGLIAPV